MKQSVNPVVGAVVAVIAILILGLLIYRTLMAPSSSSGPQINLQPNDPNAERFKPRLPPGVSGGGG